MALASVVAATALAVLWSLRMINASTLPVMASPGASAVELDTLSAYLKPLATGISAESSLAFPLPSSDPFGYARRVPASPFVEPPISIPVTPTLPPPPPLTFTVNAILTSPAGRSAIVNDSIVTVGSRLPGGARVVAIEGSHVEIVDANGKRHLVRPRLEND